MGALYPTEMRRFAEERLLRVNWSDGHVGEYAYDYLRGHCPCAACQGHAASEIVYRPPQGEPQPTRIEPVGNYAVSILWSDSHATGIYRFDFLREICPCRECSSRRQKRGSALPGQQKEGEAW